MSLKQLNQWDDLNMRLQELFFLFSPSFPVLQVPREEGGSRNLAAGLH